MTFFFSVSALKTELTMSSLQLRRKVSQLCFIHKIYYHIPDLKTTLLLPPDRTSSRLNNVCTIKHISDSTNAFNWSFLSQAISHWNSPPSSIVTILDPADFSSAVKLHLSWPM
ncbi:uncharacterized protein ISCGN_025899 [Ixodes scapularis]